MTITVLVNDVDVPPGHLERVATTRSVEIRLVRLHAAEPLPDAHDLEAVVVLGGEMGAYDTERFPYLTEEKRFLAEAVALGVPILGICLGCQLLADALGGSVLLADEPEYHFGPIKTLGTDRVVATLASGPSIALHRDTWTPPPGGSLLGRSGRFNHAFRFGSALGVQPHPEVTSDTLVSWLETPEGEALARAAGTDARTVIVDFLEVEADTIAVAERFFTAWLDEVGFPR
ncbi:MAG: type 1 glutamine amidotransferase [Actinomycetia bacterium]|nr:type 1 glutamine amidotransferase [Actinomycetes bacterium]